MLNKIKNLISNVKLYKKGDLNLWENSEKS